VHEVFNKHKVDRCENPGAETFNFQISCEYNLILKGRGESRTPNLTPRNAEVVYNTHTFKRNLTSLYAEIFTSLVVLSVWAIHLLSFL